MPKKNIYKENTTVGTNITTYKYNVVGVSVKCTRLLLL